MDCQLKNTAEANPTAAFAGLSNQRNMLLHGLLMLTKRCGAEALQDVSRMKELIRQCILGNGRNWRDHCCKVLYELYGQYSSSMALYRVKPGKRHRTEDILDNGTV